MSLLAAVLVSITEKLHPVWSEGLDSLELYLEPLQELILYLDPDLI